jgi:HEAT repeat protein
MDPKAELDLALREPQGHTWSLVAAAEEPESTDYARVVAEMGRWPPRRWLELDGTRLDQWNWYGDSVTPRGGWSRALRRREAPTLLVALASTHPNGFLRQRATESLRDRAGPLASAALAVRAVDHVPEVREIARRVLDVRTTPEDIAVIVPILLAAAAREAAAGSLERYVRSLPPEALRSLVRSEDKATRRYAVEHSPLTAAELVQVAASDDDIRVRMSAARKALAEDESTVRDLLIVRPVTVRALALSVAPEALARPRLEHCLLHRSSHLRLAAQARAGLLGVDTTRFYRDQLPARVAVLGLGETGSEADVGLLLDLLADEQKPELRRAAVRGLGRLVSRDVLLDLLPPLLDSDQASLAREASRQLRRLRFTLTGAALDRALASPLVWTREIALGLAIRRGGWDAPVAALFLYNDEQQSLREFARAALASWLALKAASAGTPTPEQANQLRINLPNAELATETERLIRFHAGLSPAPTSIPSTTLP